MGYRILQEMLAAWPPGPRPEWRLMLSLADDANEGTWQTAPGLEFMMERTGATERTVYRWLAKLAKDGYIKVVQHSRSAGCNGGKGLRAVYEIKIPQSFTERIRADLEADTAARITCQGGAGDSDGAPAGIHLPPVMAGEYPTSAAYVSNHLTPAVSGPLQDPLRAASVEGAGLRSDQNLISEDKEDFFVGPEREARRALAAQAGPQPQETETPMGPRRKRRPAA